MADPTDPLDPSQSIIEHGSRQKPFEAAIGDQETIEAVSDHIRRYIGPIDRVFHEVVSDLVHIDVYFVSPTEQRPWITLITSGMSDMPMKLPEELLDSGATPYAELMISLPTTWPLTDDAIKEEAYYWPIRCLKQMARIPHAHDTWLGEGHTIPNGQPAEPYAANTGFCCMLVLYAASLAAEASTIRTKSGKEIEILTLCPLYEDEMELKLRKGTDVLLRRFEKARVPEYVDLNRRSAAGRRFFRL